MISFHTANNRWSASISISPNVEQAYNLALELMGLICGVSERLTLFNKETMVIECLGDGHYAIKVESRTLILHAEHLLDVIAFYLQAAREGPYPQFHFDLGAVDANGNDANVTFGFFAVEGKRYEYPIRDKRIRAEHLNLEECIVVSDVVICKIKQGGSLVFVFVLLCFVFGVVRVIELSLKGELITTLERGDDFRMCQKMHDDKTEANVSFEQWLSFLKSLLIWEWSGASFQDEYCLDFTEVGLPLVLLLPKK